MGGSSFALLGRWCGAIGVVVGVVGVAGAVGGCVGWIDEFHGDLYGGHFLVSLFVVGSIDQNLVEYLMVT